MRNLMLSLAAVAIVCALAIRVLAADPTAADQATLRHLQQLGRASLMYCNENRGFLPSTWSQTLKYVQSADVYLDPRLGSKAPANWDEMTDDQKQAWVADHCEFDLAPAAGQKITKLKPISASVLATTRKIPGQPTITLFADGRAQIDGSGVEPASLPPPPATQQ